MGLFDIHVPLWQWILSQALGVISFAFVFIAFQQKEKSKQLMWQVIINAFVIAASILLLNWIIVGVSSVALTKNFTFMLTSKRETTKSLLIFFFILFSVLNITTMAITWHFASFHIIDIFLLIGLIAVNYGKALGSIHMMKIPAFSNASFKLVNAIFFRDVMGVLLCSIAIGSIAVFYFNIIRKHLRDKQETDETENQSNNGNHTEIEKVEEHIT